MIRGKLTILDIESDESDLDVTELMNVISRGESLAIDAPLEKSSRPKRKKLEKPKAKKPVELLIERDRKFGVILDVLRKERRRITPEAIRMVAERLGVTEFI